MSESLASFLDKLKDLTLELIFRHGPWFALTVWLLAYGFPSLVDKVNEGYREFKTDITHSIDRLSDSIDKSVEESRLVRAQVSGLIDARSRHTQKSD